MEEHINTSSDSSGNEKGDSKRDMKNEKNIVDTNKIEDMEVHHSHMGHGKRIRDYFFEFFMLFLAVTSGFFVDNMRERYIEKHREKQFIESLLRDIIEDSVIMDRIIHTNQIQLKGIDSLLGTLQNPQSEKYVRGIYKYTVQYLNYAEIFKHTDRTISQLKSAGNLRLIQNDVSDTIMSYYSKVENIDVNFDFCNKLHENCFKLEKELLDFKLLNTPEPINSIKDLKLLPHDSQKLDYYYNEIMFFSVLLRNCNYLLIELKGKSGPLIMYLKTTYDLK